MLTQPQADFDQNVGPVKYDLTMWMIIVPQVDLDHSMVPVKCDLTV